MPAAAAFPAVIPLVGRDAELALFRAALDDVAAGRGRTLLMSGEGGVGKTRLAQSVAEQANGRGWSVAVGRAYPVESGVPYAMMSDAVLPILKRIEPAALQTLTRGGVADLMAVFPGGTAGARGVGDAPTRAARSDATEVKARLLWTFAQFLGRYSAKQPLLLVLENLQWADASSLELLHFTARQTAGDRVLLLGTYSTEERDLQPALWSMEQSLVSVAVATAMRLEPLSRESTDELVHRVFSADRSMTREFTALLYGWTRGNPFFVEETLKALVESGRLYQRDGTWLGWELEELRLPRTVRDAVVARMNRLTPGARTVANIAAVIGAHTTYEALGAVSGLPREELLGALDELRHQLILTETGAGAPGDTVSYDFSHPILQDVLYAELGKARARLMHGEVAEALEARYGDAAEAHADELAFHFSRADAQAGGMLPRAIKYLSAAGREALSKSANREAANYLAAALEMVDRGGGGGGEAAPPATAAGSLVEDLARARQRLGDYEGAISLWMRARKAAEAGGDRGRLAAVERRMGLACFWSGRYDDALRHYHDGLEAARSAGDDSLGARLQIAMGMCLLEVGRQAEAKREVAGALETAERLGDIALLARVNRALALLHVWTGPPDEARRYGKRAIELAEASEQRVVGWQAHWAMAMVEGLTGNSAGIAQHIEESERLADELRSPVLRLWTAEVQIEYLSGIGDWTGALALGERTIAMARTLGQRTLVPRLLVWCGLIYLGRGDLVQAKRLLDEAWRLCGAGRKSDRPLDVHTIIPAHAGMAAYHLAVKDYRHAILVGERGLEIADRTGYVAWAIHRLIPIICEASLWLADFDRARRYGARLRRESEQLGHTLGLAWADACEALVEMLRGEKQQSIAKLAAAADELDSIPFVADGARLRRQLARVLSDTGDREGAMRELRRVHDIFARLGAEVELNATRDQMRELGARLPSRTPGAVAGVGLGGGVGPGGVTGLTSREIEIIQLISTRKSNKEIGSALGISSRTVSTHLSNIFGKLNVTSRGELADLVRERGLPAVTA
jgi:DNA-binding CsgD family transcriptional regulator